MVRDASRVLRGDIAHFFRVDEQTTDANIFPAHLIPPKNERLEVGSCESGTKAPSYEIDTQGNLPGTWYRSNQ